MTALHKMANCLPKNLPLLSFHLHWQASYHKVDLGGVVGDELVGFAQQVAVDAAELGLRHQTQADFVGDDDEAGV